MEPLSTAAGRISTTLHTLTWAATSSMPNSTTQPHNFTAGDNSTTHKTEDDYQLSLTALVAYLAVRIIWGVLAIFGNGLTIYVVAKFERLQTCTNYLICSLAVSDMMAGVIVPLMMVHQLYPDSPFSPHVCLIEMTLRTISTAGNTISILYISIDRYLYIAYPLRYQLIVTSHRMAVLLTVTWSYFLTIIPAVIVSASHLQTHRHLVGTVCRFKDFIDTNVTYFYLIPQFTLAVLLTIAFHVRIARIAYNQAQAINAQQQPYNTIDTAINQTTRKISGTLALVLGAYLLFIVPQYIVNLLPQRMQLQSKELSVIVYWANSWVNPLIYAWRLNDFRIAFRKLLTGTGSFNQVVPLELN